jgi:integrase
MVRVLGKGFRQRMVPLMPQVIEMLQDMPWTGEYVFPRQHPGGITHRFQTLARGRQIQAGLHDPRHTCGTPPISFWTEIPWKSFRRCWAIRAFLPLKSMPGS